MTRYAWFCTAVLLAVPAAAQDAPESLVPEVAAPAAGEEQLPGFVDSRSDPQNFDLARKKVVECEGEKFVFAWGAGAHPTKVTLCSKKDATPDDLVRMLEDAATKLERITGMAADRRIAIVEQIRTKISEIKGAAAAPPAQSAVADVQAVGPRPQATVPVTLPRPSPAAETAAAPAIAPMPAQAAAGPSLAARPRLTFECSSPMDAGRGGPCSVLGRDTRLIVTARGAVAGGTVLRFVHRNQARAEVALQPMRQGQSVGMRLPSALCAGLLKSQASVQVVSGGEVVDSVGPYLLRC